MRGIKSGIDAANGSCGDDRRGKFCVLKRQQYSRFVGAARAASGEDYPDALLVPGPVQFEVFRESVAEFIALVLEFKTDGGLRAGFLRGQSLESGGCAQHTAV